MARPGTRAAKALLKQVAEEHGITSPVLLFRLRFKRVIDIKRRYISMAREQQIPAMTIAHVLGLHHTTVLYHASPAMQERKKQHRTRGSGRCEA